MKPFLRYARARLESTRRETAYRVFITDCIGHTLGLKTRYADHIAPEPVETRTADEVIDSISEKLARLGGE